MPSSQAWYNTVGSGSAAQIVLAYDYIEVNGDGSAARLVGARADWWQKTGWSDSTNWMDVIGSATTHGRQFTNERVNAPKTWWFDPVWVPLQYGADTRVNLAVTLYGISYFRGDGNTSTFSWGVDLPQRTYDWPDPATDMHASRAADDRINLSWVPHYTGPAGSKPWLAQYIERSEGGGWEADHRNVSGELSWSSTGWTDTSTQPNKTYWYRHAARNPRGLSAWAYAPETIYTTPAAPTDATATKLADGSIQVTATNRAPQGVAFAIDDSPDGVTWTRVATDVSLPWIHAAPTTTVTHRYRVSVRVPDGSLWSAWSATSNIIQLLAKPNRPTGLTPAVAARGEVITARWTPQPVDGTPQQAYELRHRLTGAGVWATTGAVSSSSASKAFGTGDYAADFEWQVRTKHQHVDWSDWSETRVTSVTARPAVTLVAPSAGATITSGTLTVQGGYFQADSLPLASWRATLRRAGIDLQTLSGSTLAGLAQIAFTPVMLNDTTVSVSMEVQSSAGLWSTLQEWTWPVVFIAPLPPEVEILWDADRAACSIQVIGTDGAEGPAGTPTASTHEVWADGVLVGTVARTGALTYMVPNLAPGSQIEVRAISDLPSTSISMWPLPIPRFPGLHLNAGAGMLVHAAMWGGSQLSVDQMESVTAEVWEGDTAPSPTWGADDYQVVKISGRIVFDQDVTREGWRRVVRDHSTVCYRDGIRKLYGFLSGLSMTETYVGFADVTVTFTESESDPGDLLALLP